MGTAVASFQINLHTGGTEIVDGVDGYAPEGSMTTFFMAGSSRTAIDSWSTRVASFRTADISVVRRIDLVARETEDPAPVTLLA